MWNFPRSCFRLITDPGVHTMCGILLSSKRRQDVLARADLDRMHLQHTWVSQVRDFSSHAWGMKSTLCYPPSKENKLNQVLLINWLAPPRHQIQRRGEKKEGSFPSYAKLFVCANKNMSFSLMSGSHRTLTGFTL